MMFNYNILTVNISNVDKVEADDVVASMMTSRGGFKEAVDVKSRSEDGPNRQELQQKKYFFKKRNIS